MTVVNFKSQLRNRIKAYKNVNVLLGPFSMTFQSLEFSSKTGQFSALLNLKIVPHPLLTSD